ncbi:hypothetical protein F1643_03640 [Azospirillum sp. INR13]|uniref:hypothetical protein n=1 Tax=Azospirillum sp. INR13 TaxID=2596919 RepID=UPI00189267D8|nr:hypothetical protein [Azospirillum sp. INR13]MBF5093720.1 hypothetical protein [Azospirillum sp. INR13]
MKLLPIITTFVNEVVAVRGHWSEGTRHIGDWLYFDSPSRPDDFTKSVRALYDTALPSQPVEQALFYSRFWGTDIQDPDQRYIDNVNDLDFDYATRRAQGLAPAIAGDPVQLARVIEVMASEELNAPFPFAQALASICPIRSAPSKRQSMCSRRVIAVLVSASCAHSSPRWTASWLETSSSSISWSTSQNRRGSSPKAR